MVINLNLLDAKKGAVIQRNGARVKGQSVEAAFDLLDGLLLELAQSDPLVSVAARKVAQTHVEQGGTPPEKTWAFSVGVRVDTDFVGVIDGAPAVAPGITAHFQDGVFGGAAAFIIAPIPGVRAELRLVPLPGFKVKPYLGAGAVLFGPSFGVRGALGVLGKLGPVQLFVDFAVEGFLTGPTSFHALALLLGAGAAWEF